MMTRRRFLSSTAIVGLAALVPGLASAFSLESADAQGARLYLTACGSQDTETHRRLVADLRAELSDKSEAEIEAAIAATRCPVCGCAIVASAE
jgi:hypothetical protein